MDGERIWISGVGLVTALGPDVATTWPRLVAGDRALSPIGLFTDGGTAHRSVTVAEVSGAWEPRPPRDPERWSRTSAFAWKAAGEALIAAGLGSAADWRAEGLRVGLVVGGTTGGMFETELLLADLSVNGARTDGLAQMISQPLTATVDRLVESLGPFSRVRSLCSACSSGANAFAVGAGWLLAGEVDAVLVGGSDGLCRLTLSGFNALAATDPDPCRPFDVRRRGLNVGEGAGFAVLERASRARLRGASVVAELAGWALGAEAHHITNPEPSGAAAARVVARSLRRAGLSPRDIDYVNAHGTGTPLNDAMEAAALRLALGPDVERVPVSSSKGQVGHTLGAAGAVEAIFSALAVREQVLLPTMGLEEPDPACALVHVLHRGRSARVRAALSSSFGFGGMDTVLALSEPGLGPPHEARRPGARRVVVTGAAALSAHGLSDGDTAAALVGGSPAPAAPPAPAGRLAIDLALHLDAAKARRLDRSARLGAIVVRMAIAQAEKGSAVLDRDAVGLVLGTAFGSLDPSAAYLHRLLEKGPRFASPAEFPNLVPSSPVGHVSIYHGLRGATLATADLGTSGESAVLQAMELITGGEGDAFVAGAVEEASELVERALGGLYAGDPPRREPGAHRSEGAAVLVLEEEAHARARGAALMARVGFSTSWTEVAPGLSAVPPPRDASRALVVHVRRTEASASFVAQTAWGTVRAVTVSPIAGEHEGLGATALVAAAGLVHGGGALEVLVVGTTRGRGYAVTLVAAAHGTGGAGDA